MADETNAGMKLPIVFFQKSCPKYPVIRWKMMQVYSPSVTPNWPTLVLRIPVWYSIQFAVHREAWEA